MSGIRIHPKHGLNPTMVVCELCGEETGEIALLGAAYKNEAPRHMMVNHSICDKCKANLDNGYIALMEARMVRGEPQRTGGLLFIKEEAAARLFNVPMGGSKIAFIEPEAFTKLQKMAEEAEHERG